MSSIFSATEARNKFFELLNSVVLGGKEFVIEKDGRPAAKLSPVVSITNSEEVVNILNDIRKVFVNSKKRKAWSVIDTPSWKKKERSYLKNLSEGKIN